MSRSLKKGPSIDPKLQVKIEGLNQSRQKRIAGPVAAFHDLPRDGRAHGRRPRRPQARARLHQREHGGPQARRVRSDPALPRSCGEVREGEPAALMEVIAHSRFIRRGPRKARLVADMVRGMRVEEALSALQFAPQHAAHDVAKTIRSAAANAEHNFELSRDKSCG